MPTSAAPPPQLEFSLEGGAGWKKVRITSEHPYLRCLSDLIKKKINPNALMEHFKSHPSIKRLIEGGDAKEYSAHLIPEGGAAMMPPLAAPSPPPPQAAPR